MFLGFIIIRLGRLFRWARVWYARKYSYPWRNIPNVWEVKRRKKDRQLRDAVTPIPEMRPRSLTLHRVDTGSMIQEKLSRRKKRSAYGGPPQKTTDQLGKCDLFKLPFEIREQIWKLALGGHHIHIVRRRGRLGSVCCTAKFPTGQNRRDLCILQRDKEGFYKPTAWPPPMRLLSFVGSCRQIYSECIDFMYMLNTFSFNEFDTLAIFLKNTIHHRRNLISSIHFCYDFIPEDFRRAPKFKKLTQPKYEDLETWAKCCRILDALSNLQSLVVTTTVLPYGSAFISNEKLADTRIFLKKLNAITVKSHFTLAWPSVLFQVGYNLPWWSEREGETEPAKMNFEIQWITGNQKMELLTFFVPFHVRCLHCDVPAIIRRGTRGFAESMLWMQSSPDPVHEQFVTRYWTFHPACGGWMEFRYDWDTRTWSVTHGAREVSEEEAEAHFKENKACEWKEESPNERLQGVSIKGHPSLGIYSADVSTKAIDVPTRDLIYQWAGWRRPDGLGLEEILNASI